MSEKKENENCRVQNEDDWKIHKISVARTDKYSVLTIDATGVCTIPYSLLKVILNFNTFKYLSKGQKK